MEETFNIVSQEIYLKRQMDISNNQECKQLFKKIADKYLNKYKKHKNNDIEACKRDIINYSVKYFYKRIHGKPPGKIADINKYSDISELNETKEMNESTIPIPTERDIIDIKQQEQLIEKKDKIYRNLFSSDTRKIIFSVSTSQRQDLTSNTDLTIDLQDKGIIDLKNVIGFNLVRASIPVSYYNINTNNKAKVSGADVASASNGYYTTSDLTGITNINSYDSKTGKFTFGTATSTTGTTALDKSIAKVLGLVAGAAGVTESANVVDVRASISFDLEILEIPSIVCYQSEFSNNIVSRLPINGSFGEIDNIVIYSSDKISEYFQPQRLTKLTMKILDEFGLTVDFNGKECYFIFEVVVLKNVPDLGIVFEN